VAHASVILSSADVIGGAGFGDAPLVLTVQGTGNAFTESGCNSWNGFQMIVGPAACSNLANVGGDEPSPDGFPKFSTPTLASLGFTAAASIAIVFDATEPAGNSLTINSLILKFFSANGVLLLSESLLNSPLVFDNTATGNGDTDFLFLLDQNGINEVTKTIFSAMGSGDIHIGLETTMTNVYGGPESFLALDPPAASVATPEPASVALIGCGLAGLAELRRRKARGNRSGPHLCVRPGRSGGPRHPSKMVFGRR
jgi:hypothetical protein